MARTELIRNLIGIVPMVIVSAMFLLASLALSWAAQHSQSHGHWYTTLLAVNLIGIGVLSLFFVVNLLRLVRQYRQRVLGSRLMARFVLLFVTLTLLPIAAITYFAGKFVSSGVDSWFDPKIEQALRDANLLGESFLSTSKEEFVERAQADASRLGLARDDREMVVMLEEVRRQQQYQEAALFDSGGQVIAVSHHNPGVLLPDRPDDTDLRAAAQGEWVAKLEPAGEGLQFRLLAPVYSGRLIDRTRVLQVLSLLPHRYARLGETLQSASTEYNRLNYLRQPLKISFLVSLAAITLMTTLISLWLALYAAQRLVAPLSTLAAGTRAVAKGDYQTQLETHSGDEFGMLVHSFNAMTRRVSAAQQQLANTQQETEAQRAYLHTLLEHLSSGVMSFDPEGRLQTANDVASAILHVDLDAWIGEPLDALAAAQTRLAPLIKPIRMGIQRQQDYRENELRVEGNRDTQILSVQITRIQSATTEIQGYVVVFDDITTLARAQREAAWGEVARRLAHEIKNPLTPIQLSSERIRRKFLDAVPSAERDALDRATRTISEQVDTLKRMVDAFASYAKSEQLHYAPVALNPLIEDVVELHRPGQQPTMFRLELSPQVDLLDADRDGLRQVFNNLISNAIDALTMDTLRGDTDTEAPPSQIVIKTSLVEQANAQASLPGVEIRVRDNGAGYAPEILERVFEPYVTTKPQGTGLGMAIVKRIVDRHQGTIEARNLLDSAGAEVRIWLPQRSQASTAPLTTSAAA